MDDREWFENAYYYFLEAVKLLAQPPAEQCERFGYHNVAWELKDDVSRGVELLQYVSSSSLSSQQQKAISELMLVLEAVPANSLPAGWGHEENLAAMNHPAWEPLRPKAAALIELLADATERNRKYLYEDDTDEP